MHRMSSNPAQPFLGPKFMPFMALAIMAVVDVLTGGFLRESFAHAKVEYVSMTFMAIALFGVLYNESSRRPLFVRSFSRQKL